MRSTASRWGILLGGMLAVLSCFSTHLVVAAPITSFSIYGLQEVFIGVGTTANGLIGAGTASLTGEGQLNGGAGIVGDLRSGNTVILGSNAFVTGTVTNPGKLTLGGGATIGSHVVATPDLPTLPAASVFSHGVISKAVGNGGTLTLAPGSYDEVKLGGAATLELSSGDYYLRTLSSGGSLKLNADATSGLIRLFVTEDVNIAGLAAMTITGNNPHNIRVETHQAGLNAFKIGGSGGTNWTGNVFTPHGDIHLGSGSSQGTVAGYLWSGRIVDLEHGLDVYGPVIPEPSSITLASLGGLGLAGYAWRRRRRRGAL